MGEGEICIQELDGRGRPDWVMEIESEVDNNGTLKTTETVVWKKHTIYKIPEVFISDDKRKQAYKPQVVSMGPYHRDDKQLLPMEEHKRRALRQFIVRTKKGISKYREALTGVVQELMDSYKDLENAWKDDEERFLQLMIFDGCFMIEVLRTVDLSKLDGYDENDPIFSHHGIVSNMPLIRRDMLMIENQIPLLVLRKLLSVQKGIDDKDEQKQRSLNQEVNNMVLAFFGVGRDYYALELGFHALDVVRKSMIKDIKMKDNKIADIKVKDLKGREREGTEASNDVLHLKGREREGTEASNDVIWPATRLQKAGIKFRRSGGRHGRLRLKDVDFGHGYLCATLRLPQLVVADDTEYKFLNLMAFEHLHLGSGNEVSSYVSFMALIIDSEKDVSLLSRNDIIKNFVGADQAVADLFHRISYHVYIDPTSNLMTVHENVIGYCGTLKAKAAYSCSILFFHAWVWISSFSAFVLFIVTCLQLLYAMLDFYQATSSST